MEKLDLFFGIFFNIALGLFMVSKGFKIFKSSKAKDADAIAKEELWHSKWGTFFQIGGIIMLIFGVWKILNNI